MQRAVSASHVRHVVEPLERAGLTVDVFLATYGCGGLAPPARAARAMAHLVEWYGAARVVRAEQLPRRGSSQATPSLVAMRWLRALWPPGGYRSVLLWRFDVAALRPAWHSNLQPDFNVSVCDGFEAISSALLRELDESNRFVQKSAESTSI